MDVLDRVRVGRAAGAPTRAGRTGRGRAPRAPSRGRRRGSSGPPRSSRRTSYRVPPHGHDRDVVDALGAVPERRLRLIGWLPRGRGQSLRAPASIVSSKRGLPNRSPDGDRESVTPSVYSTSRSPGRSDHVDLGQVERRERAQQRTATLDAVDGSAVARDEKRRLVPRVGQPDAARVRRRAGRRAR